MNAQTRKLFAFGGTRRRPQRCTTLHHVGPFRRRLDLDEWLGAMEVELGIVLGAAPQWDCVCCGSSIGIGEKRGAA